MTTQNCLTYLLDAIALTFLALMLFDFVTGLPLQPSAAIAAPNPLDMSAIFDFSDEEICQPLVLSNAEVLVAKTIINTDAVTPNLSSMTRDRLAEIAKAYGIQHYRKGNRRKTKTELIKDLQHLQIV